MSKRRVVITGVGMVSPVGNDRESTFEALLEGRSGVGVIQAFDPKALATHIAAEVTDFDATQFLSKSSIRRLDRFTLLALVAALEAERDCGLTLKDEDPFRTGVVAGSGVGGIGTIERQHKVFLAKGPNKLNPFDVPKLMINAVGAQISIHMGLEGPNWVTASACASGAHAIASAMRVIQYGDADRMLTGGGDSAVSEMILGGFGRMRAMSVRNDEPERASRPFDRDRDGFVMGEGAAFLVIEDRELAQRRGARIYCELAGCGATADAFHIAAPRERGTGAQRSMQLAMLDGGLDPSDVTYINAHGTSTVLNDLHESLAIRDTFGAHADRLVINSSKSMTGHLLGGSGALEAAICALSISRGVVHQTLNLENPGEGCDLDYVPEGPREMRLDAVLSNSLGFGGHNCTIAFKRA